MNKKLKLTYFALVGFCMISLVAFQNCSQTASELGDYNSGQTGDTNGTTSCGRSGTPTLACLLSDGIFKYIITDANGNVLYHGTNSGSQSIRLQATGRYRLYYVGVENLGVTLPATDRVIGCAVPASSDSNACVTAGFPTQTLANPANCNATTAAPYRPLGCDPAWRTETQGTLRYTVNYDLFYSPAGVQWMPANMTIYSYIKANTPASAAAVRLVYTTY